MTIDDLPADMPAEQRDAIAAARLARESAERDLREVRKTRRELAPVWARLGVAAREDSFGTELEAALIPRGAHT